MKLLALLLLAVLTVGAHADFGVLIPNGKQAPDPAVLSLEQMTVQIVIDNGDAHISIVEVFANHTRNIQEGTYRFSLPSEATVSDFAVWDGPVRIPAVILERKRAETVYEQVRAQALDPGLLEMGDEPDDDRKRESALFSARIAPIPPFGTKRLELDYHQRLQATDFKEFFALPLKPEAGNSQATRHFKLTFELHSATPITDFAAPVKTFPLKLTQNDPTSVTGSFEGENVTFSEDFQTTWTLSQAHADTLEILTHRDPRTPLPSPGEPVAKAQPPGKAGPEPGFFEAQVLIGDPSPAKAAALPPRNVVILFDNSLSMQWEKLERTYAALDGLLHALTPADHVNVLLFHQEVTPFQPQPVPATPEAIKAALAFVRGSRLRGGTDLGRALNAGLAQSTQPDTTLVLLTDGNSDRGATVLSGKIAAGYTAACKRLPHPPHTDVLGVGDDADLTLLTELASNDGFLESILSTEPYEFKLKSFLSKSVHAPVAGLSLTVSDPAATSLVYPLDDAVYPGMLAQWVGQYRPPSGASAPVTFNADFNRNATPVHTTAKAELPADQPLHPQLPRLWAQARVDALLAQIDRDGETAAAIEEIIRLSRHYKFVTPYTSFLAVPRSLLRPRVIRPGDPVLRVRTDPAIESVIALFPFGLTKPLRHIGSEDTPTGRPNPNRLWETRFLAPPEMQDGTYAVRLLLRDTRGNVYREEKTFVIASTPPAVKLDLPRRSLHPGETIELRATASASTRNLTAHLEGAAAVPLRWNAAAHTNTGLLTVPAGLPIGRYTLTITAEDIAHNLGTQEVQVDVAP